MISILEENGERESESVFSEKLLPGRGRLVRAAAAGRNQVLHVRILKNNFGRGSTRMWLN
jgi:hypothetical protein